MTISKILSGFFLCLIFLCLDGCQSASNGPPTAYDIPRLENIPIDGNPAAWGDGGFRVDALGLFEGSPRPIEQFDQKLRFAWDDRGLLLLANVRDTLMVESQGASKQWLKTNVAIFVAAGAGSPVRYQVVVGSGLDDKNQSIMRTQVDDFRNPKPTPNLSPILARTKTADGYVVEALLPWDALGISPKVGASCAINVVVNSWDSRKLSLRVGWLPDGASEMDSKVMYTLRLADHAGPTVSYAAATAFERARWIEAIVRVGPRPGAGPIILQARNDQGELASAIVGASSESQDVVLKIPMPPLHQPLGPLKVIADGQTINTFNLDKEIEANRKLVFERADFVFQESVFSGEEFPRGDFQQPDTIQDAVGTYAIHTTYYDADYNEVKTATRPGRYGAVSEITTEAGLTSRKINALYHFSGKIDWDKTHLEIKPQFPPELGLNPATVAARMQTIDDSFKFRFTDGFSQDDDAAVLLSALSEPKPDGPEVNRTSAWAMFRKWSYGLDKKLGRPLYPYAVNLPEKYDADPKSRWPIILFLHGSGQRGIPIEKYRNDSTVVQIAKQCGQRFILISPVCPERDYWNPWELSDLLDEVAAKYRIDPDRIYVTGLSMGGFGSWDLAMAFPEKFAAVVPLCGVGDSHDMARIKDLPVWAFHGMDDEAVSFEEDQAGIQALQKIGGRVKFTAYPGVNHNCWTRGYGTAALYDWMLSQQRGKPSEPVFSPQ